MITHERLLELGFKCIKEEIDEKTYHLEIPNTLYYPNIRYMKGDYLASNPNSGIVSIYMEALDMLEFSNHLESFEQPIAWKVNTETRLLSIIRSLIGDDEFATLFLFKI